MLLSKREETAPVTAVEVQTMEWMGTTKRGDYDGLTYRKNLKTT